MFSFEIVNLPDFFDIDRSQIANIFAYFSKNISISQCGIITIAFVPDEEMQRLNAEYRGIDATTDVLSFHYFDDFSRLNPQIDVAGECIFSETKILEQAKKFHHSPEEEFGILLIHSLLHILGFDHETDADFQKMWALESPARSFFSFSLQR